MGHDDRRADAERRARPPAHVVRRRRVALLGAVVVIAAGVAVPLLLLRSGADEPPAAPAGSTPRELPEPPPGDPRQQLTKEDGPLVLTLVDARADADGGLVVLRARNRGSSPLSISDRAVRITQDGTRLLSAPFPKTRLPRFPPSIQPGTQRRAILWFPRVEPEGAIVTVPWFTTNVDVSPSPVVFRVAVRDVEAVEDAGS